ncbi:uncharacterized protein LOC129121906 isoform X1 [Agelaius phoeniceus]|uniref:uncharacterized protein LOC129121906 isoform X1 n=1 Tax=Agelaius phoeniceus TaxID=39638 RepID=UPI00405508CE
MPIPGVCSLRCCHCPRRVQEQRRAGPQGYRFPQNLPTDVKERSQKMCGSTFFSVSSKGRSECSRSVCEATFITQVWARTVQGPVFSSGRRIFLRLPETTFPRTSDCWGVI